MPDMMKIIKGLRDAIRYLEDKEWSDEDAGQHIEALIDAVELLKKQKAKPVITTTKNFMGISVAIQHSCPSCGNGLYGASEKTNYCSFCGQKLDWEQEGW